MAEKDKKPAAGGAKPAAPKAGGAAKGGAKGGKGGKEKKLQKKYKMYEISGDTIKRKNKICPKCGPGIFMATHSDRWACGKCGYMEKK